MFKDLIKLINEKQRFVITTHVNPDGDGLGSEIGFFYLLKNLGKEVFLINQDPPPPTYSFLDQEGNFSIYNKELHHDIFKSADVFLAIDLSGPNRLGAVEEELSNEGIYSVCFDHHPPDKKFADLHVVNEKASSIGEMIYDLTKEMGLNITENMARGIYVSILTDTGSFKYTNTNSKTHEIVAELLKFGIEPYSIYKNIYENNSYQKILLMGKMLNTFQLDDSGKYAWATVTQNALKETGYNFDSEDKEGFIDILRSLNGIEVVLMFSEKKEDIIKVSLRSKGNIDVNQIAMKFGGGGHPFAAGVTITDSKLDPTVQKLLKETSDSIKVFSESRKK
ncbi:MAG: bifunctional oligoribonuclease/PAP phosphatase NrnA [Nitrospinota bacterium]|nr:bifunctional oligoribonuclease/PAP phosphatase NrnA [Nitrospinota bacterium]